MANDAAVAKAGRRTLRLSMDGIDYANTYLVGSFTHNGAFPIFKYSEREFFSMPDFKRDIA